MKKIKLLLYCCKDKRGYLHFDKREDTPRNRKYYLSPDSSPFDTYEPGNYLNGKILAECDFEVEEIETITLNEDLNDLLIKSEKEKEVLEKSCFTKGQLYGYLENGIGYAIHIKNLNIFDKPRELSKYHRPYGCINISCEEKTKQKYLGCSLVRHCRKTQINKAPQNMMKVESKICDDDGKDYILISIRPEGMCLILNKVKTVEIRKRVLKEMI